MNKPAGVLKAMFEPAPKWSDLSTQIGIFGAWLVVTIIGARLNPSPLGHGTHQQLGLPPCPSTIFFDRPCPGCGLTTSWSATIHGQLGEAFHAHWIGPILYIAFSIVSLLGLFGILTRQRLKTEARWVSVVGTTLLTSLLIFGIVRFAVSPGFASGKELMWRARLTR